MIPSGQSGNLTWVRCSWEASPSLSLDYYLVELIPLILDSVTSELIPRPELKISGKTERDLASGLIPTEILFHNLQPGVSYQVHVAAVDRYGNISTVLTDQIVSGGNIPELTAYDITLNPLQVHLHGARVSWSVSSDAESRIHRFEVFADSEEFSDLTGDRLSYSGTATQVIIPANSIVYIKLRAIDILGCPSPILAGSIDAGSSAIAPAPSTA